MKLGRLEEITDLRSIWPHEARDFTLWLAQEENIDLLGSTLGLQINVEMTEAPIGMFKADILATEMNTNKKIIIENQLEDSDHDHLGKLITYASGTSANIIIWIVKNVRDEHRQAIQWLNQQTISNIEFYLCEISVYQLGDQAGVKFNLIESPDGIISKLHTIKTKMASISNHRAPSNYDYWGLFDKYASSHPNYIENFARGAARNENRLDIYVGNDNYHFGIYRQKQSNTLWVEIYIPNNKAFYNTLHTHRKEIEKILGTQLVWVEKSYVKSTRVKIEKIVKHTDQTDWENQFEWIIDTCLKFKKVCKSYL